MTVYLLRPKRRHKSVGARRQTSVTPSSSPQDVFIISVLFCWLRSINVNVAKINKAVNQHKNIRREMLWDSKHWRAVTFFWKINSEHTLHNMLAVHSCYLVLIDICRELSEEDNGSVFFEWTGLMDNPNWINGQPRWLLSLKEITSNSEGGLFKKKTVCIFTPRVK